VTLYLFRLGCKEWAYLLSVLGALEWAYKVFWVKRVGLLSVLGALKWAH